VFNIIQFDTGTEIQQNRMLTYLEQRCLNYITILNDSKGLGYFTGICWCDAKNKELAKINKEIEALAPVLLGYEAQKRIKTPNKSIQAKWFIYSLFSGLKARNKIYRKVLIAGLFPGSLRRYGCTQDSQ
jgi:hypothetical protein